MNLFGLVEIEFKVRLIAGKKKKVKQELIEHGIIKAIKLHRELYGSSLVEAKHAVYEIIDKHNIPQMPPSFYKEGE